MISAKNLLMKKSKAEGRTFLKYSDLPFGTRTLKVRASDVRETPRLNNPLCIDIPADVECDGKRHTHEATSISLNLTNMKSLAKLLGDDDLSAARGMVFTFSFSLKDNPAARSDENQQVMGFDLVAVDLPGAPAAEQPEKAKGRR